MRFKALIGILLLLGAVFSSCLVAAADPISMSGHVTMADGSDPTSVVITAASTTGGGSLTTNPSASGDYSFAPLGSGTYEVSASLNQYTSNWTYTDVRASNAALDFTLTPVSGMVTGFVSDGSVSITGAVIGLRGESNNYSTNSTGPVGEYKIDNVAPGLYTPYAEKDGYVVTILPPITVASGLTKNLNITLTPVSTLLATINGTVSYNGEALAGVTVTLTNADEVEQSTHTDSTGFYSFTSVPAGNYTLRFTGDGYTAVSKSITVLASKDRTDSVAMKKDSLPGTNGFLFGYDLAHSLMIVGLGLALVTLLIALTIRFRVGKKPELLSKEEEELKE